MSYLSAVLANTPRHYWRLADRGGSVANDIGSTRIALIETLAGSGPGVALAHPLGYSGPNPDGGSAVLGSTGFTANEVHTYTAAITLECIYWRFFQPTNDTWLLGVGEASIGFIGMGITPGGNYYGVDGVHAAVDTTVAAKSGQWVHLALTQDGTNAKLYENGVQIWTQASGAFSHAWRPTIASKPDLTFANGVPVAALSECAIYTTALLGSAIATHAAAIGTTTAPPIYNSAGVGASGGVDPIYSDADTELLKYVSRTFENAV